MPNRYLITGWPKAGKTGATACLLDAGFTLRYLDFDQNAQPILAFAKPESLSRFQRVECLDAMEIDPVSGKLRCKGQPKAVPTALQSLNKWPLDGSRALEWDDRNVLVVDSGSVMAESAMRRNMVLNSREGGKPQYGDYTAAHQIITNFLLYAKQLPCHFIMITHLFLMGPDLSGEDIDDDNLRERVINKKLEGADNVPWKLAPKTVGRALHDMAKHFSGVIYCSASGPVRRLHLVPTDGADAGVPVAGLPTELDFKDGLARIFEKGASMT